MKKICYVSTMPNVLESFVIDFAKYLHERESVEITFICNDDISFKESLPTYIKYKPIKMKRGIDATGIIAAYKMWLLFRKEKFDIIQYATPNASFYASMAAFFSGRKNRIYCQWGIVYVSFGGMKKKVFKFLEKTVCTLSTSVYPDSYGNLEFSIKEGLYGRNKGKVIWNGSANGVDLTKFNVVEKPKWRSVVRKELCIAESSTVLGFTGRIGKDKGINELLHSFNLLSRDNNDIHLIVVGPKDKIESLDQDIYLWSLRQPNIHYIGKTDIVEMYMAAMDIFILPSYREGFGSVVIEASAMEVPVIVTDIPGPTEGMVNNKTGLIVEPRSIQSLVDGIQKLLNDRIIRQKMGMNGREFVKKNFSRNIILEKIYEDRKNILNL